METDAWHLVTYGTGDVNILHVQPVIHILRVVMAFGFCASRVFQLS